MSINDRRVLRHNHEVRQGVRVLEVEGVTLQLLTTDHRPREDNDVLNNPRYLYAINNRDIQTWAWLSGLQTFTVLRL